MYITIYEIGNICCLEISGGCEGPAAPPPVSAPGDRKEDEGSGEDRIQKGVRGCHMGRGWEGVCLQQDW